LINSCLMLRLNGTESLITSSTISVAFVASLYVWKESARLDRNHPTQIKRRLISIFMVCIISAMTLLYWRDSASTGPSVERLLGMSSIGLIPALLFPLLLTMIIFSGPLLISFLTNGAIGGVQSFFTNLVSEQDKLVALRNYVIAPLFEEFVFRVCTCTLLLCGGWSQSMTILASPLLFGIAHLHHVIGLVKAEGRPLRESVVVVVFQLMYTTLFGQYAAFIFVRTGHLLSAWLSHAFCNVMGVPSLDWAFDVYHPLHSKRSLIGSVFVGGLLLWVILLFPLTTPGVFSCWFSEFHII